MKPSPPGRGDEVKLRLQAAEIAERVGQHGIAYEALVAATEAMSVVDRALVDDALLARLERAAREPAQRVHAAVIRAETTASRSRYADAVTLAETAAGVASSCWARPAWARRVC